MRGGSRREQGKIGIEIGKRIERRSQRVRFCYTCRTMADGAYLTIVPHASCLIAHITSEKVGARESQIIEQEIKAAAGGATSSVAGRKWRIVMDLKDVTMLASMGLGMLVSMHKLCAAEGGRLVVCGLREDILQLMKITHLERILKIAVDREAALKIMG